MLVNNGDKLVVTKSIASFLKEGDIAKVIDVSNGVISFAFGDGFIHKGLMSESECKEHFKKYEEPKPIPTVTEKMIEEILVNSKIDIQTIFDKCTVVTCQLPNGFVIVESSACVSPENYDEKIGFDICIDRIANKIWELEGYKLQSALYDKKSDNSYNCCNDYECCDECPCLDECFEEDEDDEELNYCSECDEYSCPDNPNYRI